jgi:hypothetical protein
VVQVAVTHAVNNVPVATNNSATTLINVPVSLMLLNDIDFDILRFQPVYAVNIATVDLNTH